MSGHSEIFDKEIGKVCDACIIWVAIGYIHSCQSISISLSLSFMFGEPKLLNISQKVSYLDYCL